MRISNQNSVRFSIHCPSVEAQDRQVKLQIHVPEVILFLCTENKIATTPQAFNFIRYQSVASGGSHVEKLWRTSQRSRND
jgi:hypothetical protein